MKRTIIFITLLSIFSFTACTDLKTEPLPSPKASILVEPSASPTPSASIKEQNQAIADKANKEYSQGGDYWESVESNIQELDKNSVYWVPKGKSYHSTKDCVALLKSSQIINGTLAEAFENGKTDPCSKCVGE